MIFEEKAILRELRFEDYMEIVEIVGKIEDEINVTPVLANLGGLNLEERYEDVRT